jgi:hypothetical protein
MKDERKADRRSATLSSFILHPSSFAFSAAAAVKVWSHARALPQGLRRVGAACYIVSRLLIRLTPHAVSFALNFRPRLTSVSLIRNFFDGVL